MGVALHAGKKRFEIGTGDFLNAFFSTIVIRLEGGRWGSRYPTVMNELYSGEVAPPQLEKLKSELEQIRRSLGQFSPDLVVWDFEDQTKQPPWRNNISPTITSLSNYFWTSDGKDLFDVMSAAVSEAQLRKESVRIS